MITVFIIVNSLISDPTCAKSSGRGGTNDYLVDPKWFTAKNKVRTNLSPR